MSESSAEIEVLGTSPGEADVERLVDLVLETVRSDAAIGFLETATRADVRAYWRGVLAAAHPNTLLFVARRGAAIVGTVQVQPARAQNQPHRAEIAKLMVHPTARRTGLGRALMEAAEAGARRIGLTLITLDTRAGDTAENLYQSLGWTRLGSIPDYALDPDGRTLHGTAVYYKLLERDVG
ncbi:MAG: GNAT family N-acetyltransferase [Planctomycetaceae bacterium]|nr:GNAT family N-acetyltransferase [Planctomycetaceae bacterium]